MILTLFTCDRCHDRSHATEVPHDQARREAMAAGWRRINGCHFCPACALAVRERGPTGRLVRLSLRAILGFPRYRAEVLIPTLTSPWWPSQRRKPKQPD